jgi:hypothetical protein
MRHTIFEDDAQKVHTPFNVTFPAERAMDTPTFIAAVPVKTDPTAHKTIAAFPAADGFVPFRFQLVQSAKGRVKSIHYGGDLSSGSGSIRRKERHLVGTEEAPSRVHFFHRAQDQPEESIIQRFRRLI